MDFINWYWDQRVYTFSGNTTNVSEDCLCRLVIKDNVGINCWNVFVFNNSCFFKDIYRKERYSGSEVIQYIKDQPNIFSIECCPFFKTILQSIETKGWVDIENDYYQLLKVGMDSPGCNYTISELNEQFAFLQEKLIEYLHTIETDNVRNDLQNAIIDFFDPADFSTEGKKKALDNIGLDISSLADVEYNYGERDKLIPKRIMLLSFNYTKTAKMYGNFNITHNYIHGELEKPENIIFGYGDELDKS